MLLCYTDDCIPFHKEEEKIDDLTDSLQNPGPNGL